MTIVDIALLFSLFLITLLIIDSFQLNPDCNELINQASEASGLQIRKDHNQAYPYLFGIWSGRSTKIELQNTGGCEGVLPSISLVITMKINKILQTSIQAKKKHQFFSYQKHEAKFFEDIYDIVAFQEPLIKIFSSHNIRKNLSWINFDWLIIKEQELKVIEYNTKIDPQYLCFCLFVAAKILDLIENTEFQSEIDRSII